MGVAESSGEALFRFEAVMVIAGCNESASFGMMDRKVMACVLHYLNTTHAPILAFIKEVKASQIAICVNRTLSVKDSSDPCSSYKRWEWDKTLPLLANLCA